MKRSLILLILFLGLFAARAQDAESVSPEKVAKNSVTLGWSGAVYTDGQIVQPLPLFYLSASYERRVWTNQSGRFSLLGRGGFGFILGSG